MSGSGHKTYGDLFRGMPRDVPRPTPQELSPSANRVRQRADRRMSASEQIRADDGALFGCRIIGNVDLADRHKSISRSKGIPNSTSPFRADASTCNPHVPLGIATRRLSIYYCSGAPEASKPRKTRNFREGFARGWAGLACQLRRLAVPPSLRRCRSGRAALSAATIVLNHGRGA